MIPYPRHRIRCCKHSSQQFIPGRRGLWGRYAPQRTVSRRPRAARIQPSRPAAVKRTRGHICNIYKTRAISVRPAGAEAAWQPAHPLPACCRAAGSLLKATPGFIKRRETAVELGTCVSSRPNNCSRTYQPTVCESRLVLPPAAHPAQGLSAAAPSAAGGLGRGEACSIECRHVAQTQRSHARHQACNFNAGAAHNRADKGRAQASRGRGGAPAPEPSPRGSGRALLPPWACPGRGFRV